MRLAIAVLVPAVFAFCQSAPAGDKAKQETKDGITWKMDYLDKTWGIKFKSASDPKLNEVKLLFEFGKDVTDLTAMRGALSPRIGIPKASDIKLYFYFFDEDNVSLGKTHHDRLEGELSGKQGDAFKIGINIGTVAQKGKIKKVEVRPNEAEKEGK